MAATGSALSGCGVPAAASKTVVELKNLPPDSITSAGRNPPDAPTDTGRREANGSYEVRGRAEGGRV